MRKAQPVPQFGRLLKTLRTRGGEKRSREWVRRRIEQLGVLVANQKSIKRYEDGREISDPALLWALATIYGVTPDSLLQQYVAARTGRPVDALIPEEFIVRDARDYNIIQRFNRLPFSEQTEFLTWLDERLAHAASSKGGPRHVRPVRQRKPFPGH